MKYYKDGEIEVKTPGKIILFGEHAVVYGYPAIAGAINLFSFCKIQKTKNRGIQFDLPDFNLSYNEKSVIELSNLKDKFPQFYYGINEIAKKHNLDLNYHKITLYSEIWPGSGLGSSASISTALIIGLNKYFRLKLRKTQILDYTYSMEKFVHGQPSGIDNTICIKGGLGYFKNKKFKYKKKYKKKSFNNTEINVYRKLRKHKK